MVDQEPCCLVMEFIYEVTDAVTNSVRGLPHVVAFVSGRLGGFTYEVVHVLAEALDPSEGALGYVSSVCF